MPLFMDVHTIEGGVSSADVAAAHQADVATQVGRGVDYRRYWVDEAGRQDLLPRRGTRRRCRQRCPPRCPRTRRRRDLPGRGGLLMSSTTCSRSHRGPDGHRPRPPGPHQRPRRPGRPVTPRERRMSEAEIADLGIAIAEDGLRSSPRARPRARRQASADRTGRGRRPGLGVRARRRPPPGVRGGRVGPGPENRYACRASSWDRVEDMTVTIHLLGRPHVEQPDAAPRTSPAAARAGDCWPISCWPSGRRAAASWPTCCSPTPTIRCGRCAGAWPRSVAASRTRPRVEGDPVVLRLGEGVRVDVDVVTHGSWVEAVAMPGLGAELLEGSTLRATPAFDSWLLSERRRIAAASEAILHEAAVGSMSRGDFEAARGYAVRAAAMNPTGGEPPGPSHPALPTRGRRCSSPGPVRVLVAHGRRRARRRTGYCRRDRAADDAARARSRPTIEPPSRR